MSAGLRSGLGRGTITIRGFTDTTPLRTFSTRTRIRAALEVNSQRSRGYLPPRFFSGEEPPQSRMLSIRRVLPTKAATATKAPREMSGTGSSVSGSTISK